MDPPVDENRVRREVGETACLRTIGRQREDELVEALQYLVVPLVQPAGEHGRGEDNVSVQKRVEPLVVLRLEQREEPSSQD